MTTTRTATYDLDIVLKGTEEVTLNYGRDLDAITAAATIARLLADFQTIADTNMISTNLVSLTLTAKGGE